MPQPSVPYAVAGKETILETGDARVTLLTLAPGQTIPPHRHTAITDTTFCLSGAAALTLSDPPERLVLEAGDRATVSSGRVHSLANPGPVPVRLLLIQGPGPYDFVPA